MATSFSQLINIDCFPFDLSGASALEGDYILISNPGWMGPKTPEVELARIEGLRRAWDDADDRRKAASIAMTLARPTMPYASSLTEEHKKNIGKGMIGNTNKLGKPGRNQHSK